VLQRVSHAAVEVEGQEIARIGTGLLVLLGVAPSDTDADAVRLAAKTLALRIFPDELKPMNRSVVDVVGDVLVVSQFTLTADTSRGNRPGFSTAAPPPLAERLYERFAEEIRARHGRVATGRFGADMRVTLANDGPVTFVLD
jgi:D-tyrosyl-tRNA(Tyr) deacylase